MKATSVENKQCHAWNTMTNEFEGIVLSVNTYKSAWVFYNLRGLSVGQPVKQRESYLQQAEALKVTQHTQASV